MVSIISFLKSEIERGLVFDSLALIIYSDMKKNLSFLFLSILSIGYLSATEEQSLDQIIDNTFAKSTGWFVNGIFSKFDFAGYGVQWIVLWLALGGVISTLVFKFINITGVRTALKTVTGKYTEPDAPGQITHFQALATAVSGTVGLGNIAGVAIGIALGGPGVAFWLFLAGFLGMATKFAECTLGVKYRKIDADGTVRGGAMYYLKEGLKERGLAPLGIILSFLFAIFCVLASFGGGNIFQVNQVTSQLINITGGEGSYFATNQWVFGAILAVLTALVILGGIKSISKVTSSLVPLMCVVYVISALLVIFLNIDKVPEAIQTIISEAFKPRAAITGGAIGAIFWGIKRSTFSNEAGIGSAPIAHSAVKTNRPASEGLVALLEPFLDTVVVCSMTSLVLVIGMEFNGDSSTYTLNGKEFTLGQDTGFSLGIQMTSLAFETVHSSFKYILFACVFLFAFSTLLTWSYYGLQAWQYLFGKNKIVGIIYKVLFCLIIIVGSSASMGSAVDFSDASLFAMAIPNLIGVYLMIPMVKGELKSYLEFTKKKDAE